MLLDRIKAASLALRKASVAGRGDPDDTRSLRAVESAELNSLIGEIESKTKSFVPARPMRDDEVTAVIRKYVTNAEDSLKEIGRLPETRREEERAKLAARLATLARFMPSQMDRSEIEAFVRPLAASGGKIGDIMAALKAAHAGRYSGQVASAVIREALA